MKRILLFASMIGLFGLIAVGCSTTSAVAEDVTAEVSSIAQVESDSDLEILLDEPEESLEVEPADVPDVLEEEVEEALRPWYDYCTLIAHALGQIDGRTETNSREAFLSSYESGIRAFEADFQMTSDGVLVVRHDFDQDSYWSLEQTVDLDAIVMDSARYVTEKINYKYTPLTAEDLLTLLIEYEDAFLITDSKEVDEDTVTAQFTALVEIAENLGCPEVLDRVVVQIYNQEMLDVVRDIYPFQNWIFTLYMLTDPDLDEIGAFCEAEGIDVVTIDSVVFTKEKGDILNSYDVKIFTHTLNRLMDVEWGRYRGAYGVYSDILTQADLELIGMGAPYSR